MQTEAWVLHEGPLPAKGESPPPRGPISDGFRLEQFEWPDPTGDDCLIEPLYGSWEGNISHAISREPTDVCRQRREKKIVMGNSGVVRILKPGPDTVGLREGDICMLRGTQLVDRYGYMTHAVGYDAPKTMGLMAKRGSLPGAVLTPVPKDSGYSLAQWAAFNLRYFTAWSNHRLSYGTWRLQVTEQQFPEGFPVWAWGGGVAYAQLTLARLKDHARGTLITSRPARRDMAARAGLETLDRSAYPDLYFSGSRYDADPEYAARYRDNEKRFVQEVLARTDGLGAAIFIDNIGAPVFRATLKALAREGVITTCGWAKGMRLELIRALECISRHSFIHTHYANRQECEDAIRFACERDWMVPVDALGKIWEWEEISQLAEGHISGAIDSLFPVFRINPE